MKHIIYLHGFNSSPQSEKARLTSAFFESSPFQVHVPALPPSPDEAINTVRELIDSLGRENVVGFVGSSLGGYYSLYLHKNYDLPAVLINPAIKPYELLVDYLGENTNLYTGETYLVEPHHMEALKALEVEVDARSSSLYLLTQTADEVLDYSEATEKLSGVKSWIIFGGDHAFQDYESVLPSVKLFFKTIKPK